MRRRGLLLVAAAGVVSMVLGIALVLAAGLRYDGAVGWVAYGSDGVEEAMATATRRFWVEAGDSALPGALLVLVGLMLEAAVVGMLLGRRGRAASDRAPEPSTRS